MTSLTPGPDPAFSTTQEGLWAGDFGTDYVARNAAPALVADNAALFGKVLAATGGGVGSVLELGPSIGNNLRALRALLPAAELHSVEINAAAAAQITAWGGATVEVGTIIGYDGGGRQWDLTFTKGVLIHVFPDALATVYDTLVRASRRWVMVCEYYNPTPVEVPYRGQRHALFKRDFAGEILDAHPELALVNYGFTYHRDPQHPLDDSTWFLMEKQS